MPKASVVALLSELGAGHLGVFRGRDAVRTSVTRKQLHGLLAHGVIDRVHPDTYRMTAVPPSNEQLLRAALLWAGDAAAAAGRSAGEVYGLEGVIAKVPEIAVPPSVRARSSSVIVHHIPKNASMIRSEMALCPHPAHKVVLLPRYGASSNPIRFVLAAMLLSYRSSSAHSPPVIPDVPATGAVFCATS